MNKKKNFWNVLVIIMAVVMNVSFISCSSDDENGGGPLVGSWYCNKHFANRISPSEDATDTYTFKSDGTYEWNCPGWNDESGRYTYNKESGILTRTNQKGTTWVEMIVALTDTHFVLIDEDGDRYTYYKR